MTEMLDRLHGQYAAKTYCTGLVNRTGGFNKTGHHKAMPLVYCTVLFDSAEDMDILTGLYPAAKTNCSIVVERNGESATPLCVQQR